jgi:hypothetical protein
VHFRLLIHNTEIPVQGFSARGVQQSGLAVKYIQGPLTTIKASSQI